MEATNRALREKLRLVINRVRANELLRIYSGDLSHIGDYIQIVDKRLYILNPSNASHEETKQ